MSVLQEAIIGKDIFLVDFTKTVFRIIANVYFNDVSVALTCDYFRSPRR